MNRMHINYKERSMLSTKRAVLLVALVAMAISTCLGATAYAAYGARTSKILPPERIGIFDPFTLSVIAPTESGSGAPGSRPVLLVRPPIRVPVRPAYRSSFRPPLFAR
jgi:hypothetical protein